MINKKLSTEIINHIYSQFKIVPSSFISENAKSLIHDDFVLSNKLKIEIDEKIIEKKIWGCQTKFENNIIKIILTNCSQDKDFIDLAMVVSIENMPFYGLYLSYHDGMPDEPLIVCSLDGDAWLECNTFLQSTFLAGMEKIRELPLNWELLSDYDIVYKSLIKLINFQHKINEDK